MEVEAGEIVVVMAREPVPGAVKTRLARVLGPGPACELYVAFLRDLTATLRKAGRPCCFAVHPPGADLGGVVGEAVPQIDQRGGDLAERMRNTFLDIFRKRAARVVMIGADLPHLGAADLDAAFAALRQDDVVLLPVRDGGYGLVGLSAPVDIFSGIPMGSPRVLEETAARCRALGLRLHLLPESFDVDEAGDLRLLEQWIAAGRARLPATAATLARLRGRG